LPRRTCRSSSVAPTLIALGVLAIAACGARTPLDSPVKVTGSAGTGGRAGTSGHAGTTGHAGSGGAGTGGAFAGIGGFAGSNGFAGTGGAECEEGKTRCASLTTNQLCQDGKWGFPSPCPMQCLSGVCTECVPGDKQCAGPAAVRTCTSHGLWPEETEACPGAVPICSAGVCSNVDGGVPDGGCMEGTAECQDSMTVRLCQGGVWATFFACENGCIGGICAECKAGDVRCNGQQKCTDMGIWEGTPCNN
jgi:hypothetical protein